MAVPSKIQLHKKSKVLEIHFDQSIFNLPAELLRVYSPSAEVKGHGPEEAVLQVGKIHVGINTIEMVGNYALRIGFDDGHDSGIFSWDYLFDLGAKQDQHWANYVERLDQAGASRDPNTSVVKFIEP